MSISQTTHTLPGHDVLEGSLQNIRQALEGLRFGNITITIHEGRIVQIDVTEKRRFSPR